jgi:hypothetical protein
MLDIAASCPGWGAEMAEGAERASGGLFKAWFTAETLRRGERMRSVMGDIGASSPGWGAEIAEGAERDGMNSVMPHGLLRR